MNKKILLILLSFPLQTFSISLDDFNFLFVLPKRVAQKALIDAGAHLYQKNFMPSEPSQKSDALPLKEKYLNCIVENQHNPSACNELYELLKELETNCPS